MAENFLGFPSQADDQEKISAAFERDGFVLFRAILSADEVATGRKNIDELQPGHWDFTGLADHYTNVFNRDPYWLTYLDRAGVIDLAEDSWDQTATSLGKRPGGATLGLPA